MRQLIPLLLLAAAAQSTTAGVPGTSALPPGVWKGTVETVNVEAGGTSYSGNLEMRLVSCRGEIQIFTTADGETDQMPPVTAVHSLEGSHLFYYAAAAAKQPDWVDIQTISVVELSDSKVWVFWGRAVNNRDLETRHPNRYFRGTTLGELTRVSSECPAPTADSPVPSAP